MDKVKIFAVTFLVAVAAFFTGTTIGMNAQADSEQGTGLRAYSVTYNDGDHGHVCAHNLAEVWSWHPHGYMVTGRDADHDHKCKRVG